MKNQRRKFSSEFKSKVVLEAISHAAPIDELAEKFDLDRKQISAWKKHFVAKAHLIFEMYDESNPPDAMQ
jgi:transposase